MCRNLCMGEDVGYSWRGGPTEQQNIPNDDLIALLTSDHFMFSRVKMTRIFQDTKLSEEYLQRVHVCFISIGYKCASDFFNQATVSRP